MKPKVGKTYQISYAGAYDYDSYHGKATCTGLNVEEHEESSTVKRGNKTITTLKKVPLHEFRLLLSAGSSGGILFAEADVVKEIEPKKKGINK